MRVRFLGDLGAAEVREWMRRAALLAAPSVTAADGDAEGLPTVIVEAAASGLPVVATRHSGIPEAVGDGETGFLVPERDAETLAARMAPCCGGRAARADGPGRAADGRGEVRLAPPDRAAGGYVRQVIARWHYPKTSSFRECGNDGTNGQRAKRAAVDLAGG